MIDRIEGGTRVGKEDSREGKKKCEGSEVEVGSGRGPEKMMGQA